MISTKPYLLRAIHEWAEDNAYTPQVLVNASFPGVDVPKDHIVDGQIVLNISSSAAHELLMDNDYLSFSARFSGKQYSLYLPMDSIIAIFARENSQGIFFEETDPLDDDPETQTHNDEPDNKTKASNKKKPNSKKKKASHLKVIK